MSLEWFTQQELIDAGFHHYTVNNNIQQYIKPGMHIARYYAPDNEYVLFKVIRIESGQGIYNIRFGYGQSDFTQVGDDEVVYIK